jgi:hypothetical protein
LLTGWAQQDGSLLKLHDGTIVMPFAHKDKGYGTAISNSIYV